MKSQYGVFQPINSIWLVSEKGISEVSLENVKIETVGEKAYGLACLPGVWTLPFFVVSHDLFNIYKVTSEDFRDELLNKWLVNLNDVAIKVGLNIQDDIIIRSSGCAEGMTERGQFYSVTGTLSSLHTSLRECLDKLNNDKDVSNKKFPIVIQKYIQVISEKGHLSNERRFSNDRRDWAGEFESETGNKSSFNIYLRTARDEINIERTTGNSLLCNLKFQLTKALEIVSEWGYSKNSRLHFEWIWDGERVYIVQADQEKDIGGINPIQVAQRSYKLNKDFIPRCLKLIDEAHASRFRKIRNVYTYLKLNLPITKLYILDNQEEILKLTSGNISPQLEADIRELVKEPLIIRTDIDTDDLNKRQLLPRKEIYDYDSAVKWLKEQSAEIKKENPEDVVFIFHNFIPAVSAAFAYAVPDHRFVKIEALWGMPEGLYYNSHDKYVVDTNSAKLDKIDPSKFNIKRVINYKHYFVSPDKNGNWKSQIIQPPYDWKESIQNDDWIKEIALQSRRISQMEGKSLSIMWFVEVPEEVCSKRVFPWYHEEYDMGNVRPLTYRMKTPYDKTFVIETNEDIAKLKEASREPYTNIRCIKIQPRDDSLLRSKHTLKDIGELAKRINATIYLEGGILSHAYYQLVKTGAIVEAKHTFIENDNIREFNKLVRDKIPSRIEENGEEVITGKLEGEYFLRALKQKLIEEAFEVLDADMHDSLIEELADVSEVIDGILSYLNVGKSELELVQAKKRKKAGGFKEGIVLLKTLNPTHEGKAENELGMDIDCGSNNVMLKNLDQNIVKRSEKKEFLASTEFLTKFFVPMVRDKWKVILKDGDFNMRLGNNMEIIIEGGRKGSNMQIELSAFKGYEQLTFLNDK